MRCLLLIYLLLVSIAEATLLPYYSKSLSPPRGCGGVCGVRQVSPKCKGIFGAYAVFHRYPKVQRFNFVKIKWVKASYYEVTAELELGVNIDIKTFVDISIKGSTGMIDIFSRARGVTHLSIVGKKSIHFTWMMRAESYRGLHCSSPFEFNFGCSKFKAKYLNGCGLFGWSLYDSPQVCWRPYCR